MSAQTDHDLRKQPRTGIAPRDAPGYDAATRTLGSVAQPRLDGSRQAVVDYFENGWSLTELLFTSVREDAFYRKPLHGLRHPLIFYYGHTACLAVNKLRVAGLLTAPVNAHFENLFEQGVDEMRWDDVNQSAGVWPEFQQVVEYREQVRDVMLDVIHANLPEHSAACKDYSTESEAMWAITMICEHERIHIETSSVLIRELPLEFVSRPAEWPRDHASAAEAAAKERAEPRFVPVACGRVALGKLRSEPSYGWDNEYGARAVDVPAFEATESFVTNAEFLEFVKAGGYADDALWSPEGWGWRSFRNTRHPHFWVPRGPAGYHDYALRLPFEETAALPPRLPAEVNVHEAEAFANWLARKHGRAYRLPTEAEHHRLRQVSPKVPALGAADANNANGCADDTGARLSSAELRALNVNVNLAWGSPSAALDAWGSSPFKSVAGSCSEWCLDTFAALPGFSAHPFYDDFSSPCFDGKHHVIVGGSFASTGNEASKFARFHFRPHFHQHAGFRVAVSEQDPPELTSHGAPPPYADGWTPSKFAKKLVDDEGAPKYEGAAQLASYLDLHVVRGGVSVPRPELEHATRFPERCAHKLIAASNGRTGLRALDVGCAVGGSTFELARSPAFASAVGIDYSAQFVDVAEKLRVGGAIAYQPVHEGSSTSSEVRVEDAAALAGSVSFAHMDACAIDVEKLGGPFDAVLAANLLCRLPDPRAFLASLPGLVNQHGHVFIVSPFSWMEQYTAKDKWLCDSTTSSADALTREMVQLGFELVEAEDMPLVIKDHSRKFQYIVSHGQLFRKL
ncbi:C-type lectin protein [Pelagophyceae sp. CCMP2097]|nr:C-type lectin protein [Pelagophyceae sp. CCMP2097]